MPTPLADDVMDVLKRATRDGLDLHLPPKLDRKLYQRVDVALKTLGITWSKKRQCHECADDRARQKLELLLDSGTLVNDKKEFQFFETPEDLANRMAGMVVQRGDAVLEPSCGTGRLILAAARAGAKRIVAYELNPETASAAFTACDELPIAVAIRTGDFMSAESGKFDCVIMNPPFSNMQDIAHVQKAFGFLKPGGRLVAVMSPSWQHSERKAAVDFREFFHEYRGKIEALPFGTFRESGTGVQTVLVTLNKPAPKKAVRKKAPVKKATT